MDKCHIYVASTHPRVGSHAGTGGEHTAVSTMRYMPARNPDIAQHTENALAELGSELRSRRLALGVSAVTTAEAAGMSRVTLHRIEAGSPAVTIGAYANAAAALGLRLTFEGCTPRPKDRRVPQQVRTRCRRRRFGWATSRNFRRSRGNCAPKPNSPAPKH